MDAITNAIADCCEPAIYPDVSLQTVEGKTIIAHAFSYMKLMEHWGSGIPRIIECVIEAGLKEPEFVDGDVDLRINIYRGQIGDKNTDVTNSVTNKTQEEAILSMIKANSMVTQSEMAATLGVSPRTVKRILAKMQEAGIVSHQGTSRAGKWVINREYT